jgi:hypothetical protein
MEEVSLKNIRNINDLHESQDNTRLAVFKDWSPEVIYTAIIYGNEEVFTSTFNLLFDGKSPNNPKKESLIFKMKQGFNNDGYKFLEKVDSGFKTFNIFLCTCAKYDKLNDFLKTMSEDNRIKLLNKLIDNLPLSDKPLDDAISIAETLSYIKENKVL